MSMAFKKRNVLTHTYARWNIRTITGLKRCPPPFSSSVPRTVLKHIDHSKLQRSIASRIYYASNFNFQLRFVEDLAARDLFTRDVFIYYCLSFVRRLKGSSRKRQSPQYFTVTAIFDWIPSPTNKHSIVIHSIKLSRFTSIQCHVSRQFG